MKRERKTYEYRCDSCQFFDLASGEELPRGWLTELVPDDWCFYSLMTYHEKHTCPECAARDASSETPRL